MHVRKIITLCVFLPLWCLAQCPTSVDVRRFLATTDASKLSGAEKLAQGMALQKKREACSLPKDSSYALLLHWMGRWASEAGRMNEAIEYTRQAIQINTAADPAANPQFALKSCFNLGWYYERLRRTRQALAVYDMCIRNGGRFADPLSLIQVLKARDQKRKLFFEAGNYDNVIVEASLALPVAKALDSSLATIALLNARAEAQAALNRLGEAKADATAAASLIAERKSDSGNDREYADAQAFNFKVKADISEAEGLFAEAVKYHQRAINVRRRTKDTFDLAYAYLNAGNTLRQQCIAQNRNDFYSANRFYTTALFLAGEKDNTEGVEKALNMLATLSFRSGKFSDALQLYHKSLLLSVPAFKNSDCTLNPAYQQCYTVGDKNLLSTLLANKAECLLNFYRQSGNEHYLTAALSTARLTDSVITDMRHEQTGEQSKLYWRKNTRWFFANAIEACCLANKPDLAFYFMEKSRAVLLNDKLNELGASAQLPPAEAAREQALQNDVFALQEKLAGLAGAGPAYNDAQVKFFTANETLSRYRQILQEKFPAYYQYKYADDVPTLQSLQRYLSSNGQSFVHYFTTDTALYTLTLTPTSATLLKQKVGNLGAALSNFLNTCSDLQQLQNSHASFARQAFNLQQILFKPLGLPKGRVIVCSDAAAIPFEALTTDAEGHDFLLRNYSFSYVYSARYLLKKFANPPGTGTFMGVAPVSYASYLGLQPLLQSAASLKTSAAYFDNPKLLTGNEADTKTFLRQLPYYNIVAVFSHARADSGDKEPVLFMADSAIGLSRLQQLRSPSTQLMVLSACQTNAGRLATGEGVFSLARGFAAAGIPAITATVWKADEGAIYAITQIFLQNVAAGMRKDDALQAAKIAFMQTSDDANSLPYYWANMIVVGNAAPVTLTTKVSWTRWAGGAAVLVAIFAGFLLIRKKSRRPV